MARVYGAVLFTWSMPWRVGNLLAIARESRLLSDLPVTFFSDPGILASILWPHNWVLPICMHLNQSSVKVCLLVTLGPPVSPCAIFFFFGCICSIWKFLGQGSNMSHSCNLCHSCSNTRSLTPEPGQGLKPHLSRDLSYCRDNAGCLTHCTTAVIPPLMQS